jgi:hypothetical protein
MSRCGRVFLHTSSRDSVRGVKFAAEAVTILLRMSGRLDDRNAIRTVARGFIWLTFAGGYVATSISRLVALEVRAVDTL